MPQQRPAGIFLSHAHEDQRFVRRLARDLGTVGIRVWVDEAEMRVGDPLDEMITGAISEMDYLGVVISRHSARSEWVRREVEIALRGEVDGKTVNVLPILLRGGELPEALAGKTYADFTSELTYPTSLQRLMVRLGVEGPSTEAADRLSELTSASSMLRGALAELRDRGISNATADALLSSQVDDSDLSEFLNLAAREVDDGQKLFGLALTIVPCIDRRGVGHEALDHCLGAGRLTDDQLRSVAQYMVAVDSLTAVLWCHSRLTSVIRHDGVYHYFLKRHIDTILDHRADEMASYLLQPNRGPGGLNVDSFELLIYRLEHPGPFRRRWVEWINDGYFDGQPCPGSESATVLYHVLNRHWGQEEFEGIRSAVHTRVHFLLKSPLMESMRQGLHHLVAMVDARYRGAEQVLADTVSRVNEKPIGWWRLFQLVEAGLQAVAAYHRDPTDPRLDQAVQDVYMQIAKADTEGITGHWRARET